MPLYTSDIPGSQTALSLASDPANLIPIVAAGGAVLVTIGAVALVYREYSQYKEKYRKKIEKVNALHKKHLEKIPIYENRDLQGFPPIFKLNKGEKATNVESLHFTDDQINDVGNGIMPQGMDVSLSKYRECILNAIMKLKAYYLERNKHHDITAGVLSYLLYMLEKKLLNFEGYEYDIAYLTAFSKFIIDYMSMLGTEKAQRFQRLNPVRAYLLEAKQELEKHQKALSLENMISDLNRNCVSASKKLIRTFVHLITPEKDWRYVKTATFDELQNDILRKKYTRFRIGELVFSNDGKKEIPNSKFKDWLSGMLKYFAESINPASSIKVEDILPPEKVFVLPDLSRRKELKGKSKKRDEKEELAVLNGQVKSIRNIFAKCDNFITTKLDIATVNDQPKYIHITNDSEIMARSRVLADFATLIHQAISLQYMSVYLLKSIKQLGEIYMRDPNHFVMIFETLESLCEQIKAGIENNKQAFAEIQKQNKNISQLAEKELLPEDTMSLLDTTYAIISRISGTIKQYRDDVVENGDLNKPTIESVNHEMLEVANKIVTMYHLERHSAKETKRPSRSGVEISIQTSPRQIQTFEIDESAESTRTFWQMHKYKILAAVAITISIASFLIATGLTIFSYGALSPLAAIIAGYGVKIGLTGLALVGVDALFGLGIGLLGGGAVDAAIVASVAVHNILMSHKRINHRLKTNQVHLASKASNDSSVNGNDSTATKPTKTVRHNDNKIQTTPKLWQSKSIPQIETEECARPNLKRSASLRHE